MTNETENGKKESRKLRNTIEAFALILVIGINAWGAASIITLRETVIQMKGTIDGLTLSMKINSDRLIVVESLTTDIKAIQERQRAMDSSITDKWSMIQSSQQRIENLLYNHVLSKP